MLEWDRLLLLVVGTGVAVYTGVVAWRLWHQAQKRPAVGIFLLGCSAVLVPIAFTLWGG